MILFSLALLLMRVSSQVSHATAFQLARLASTLAHGLVHWAGAPVFRVEAHVLLQPPGRRRADHFGRRRAWWRRSLMPAMQLCWQTCSGDYSFIYIYIYMVFHAGSLSPSACARFDAYVPLRACATLYLLGVTRCYICLYPYTCMHACEDPSPSVFTIR